MSFRPTDPSAGEQGNGHRKSLKRLIKGKDAGSQPDGKVDRHHDFREATPIDVPRPKTGLKLKIKFTGAARKIEVVNHTLPDVRSVELDALCLPEDQWLRDSPPGWRFLRESPQLSSSHSAEQEKLEVAQQPLQQPEHPPEVHPEKRRRIDAPVEPTAPTTQHAAAVGVLEAAAMKGESRVAEAKGTIEMGCTAATTRPELRQKCSSAAAVDATARILAADGVGEPAADDCPGEGGKLCIGVGGPGDMAEEPNVRQEAEARATRENCSQTEKPRASAERHRPLQGAGERLNSRDRSPQPTFVRTGEKRREEDREREHGRQREVGRRREHERRWEENLRREEERQRDKDRRREEEKCRSQDKELKRTEEHPTSAERTCGKKSPPVVEEKEPGEASPESSSESSDSSSSSSSESETSSADSRAELQRKRSRSRSASPSKSRSRSRSREPGEHSDSEERPRKHQYFAPSRSRSCSPDYRRENERERSRYYTREEERRYERARYERSRRFSRDPGDRRHEREYDRHESDRRHREREGRDSWRTQSRTPEVQVPKDRARTRAPTRERSPRAPTRERSPRPLSRLGDPIRATKSQGIKDAIKEPQPKRGTEASRNIDAQAKSGQEDGSHKAGQQPERLQSEALVHVFGFADAWNMLYGSASEDFGSEAEMETLRSEATKAKHDIDSAAKAKSGKHSLASLVVLMRDSFLKYMQVCAIWETLLRLPAAPPTRTRAKLADDGGMYPCTIKLMRQIATDARGCTGSAEGSRILRVLAERLVAVMHMRLVQVQRGKLHQDRQVLLACTGAPTSIDSYGRIIPGAADAPGETFQRPSPTDSNASNSTGELSVNPSPGRSARPAVLPVKTPPPARTLPKPSNVKGLPNTTQQGKVSKVAKGGKGGQKANHQVAPTRGASTGEEAARGGSKPSSRMPVPTGPGRDDAWTVQPLAWEIAANKAEHVTRSWSLLGGVASFTGQFRAHFEETGALMQSRSPLVKEAAAMLGFLDVGLGLSNMGLVLQLSRNILELVLKIDASGGALPAQPCNQ